MLGHSRWLIDLHLADGLPAPLEQRLRSHLRGCERCRAYYDENVRLLRAVRGGAPGMGELARIERLALGAISGSTPGRVAVWGVAGAAVAAALIAFVAYAALATDEVGRVASAGTLTIEGAPARVGDDVPEGALVVAVKGTSELSLEGGRTVLLTEGTAVRVGAKGAVATLEAGRARFSVEPEQRQFVVVAGEASVEVQGTVFTVDRREKDEVLVHVERGRVRVAGKKNAVVVSAGQATLVRSGSAAAPRRSGRYIVDDAAEAVRQLRLELQRELQRTLQR